VSSADIQHEAQMSQRDRVTLRAIEYFAKSLKVIWRSRVITYYHSIDTMSVSRTVSEIFSVKEWGDLETRGRGRSRSLKMALFARSYTTFYW